MDKREHRLAAIMYTDIKDFSRMMEADELGTLQLLDYHNQVIRQEIREHRGTLIKTIGDAVLAHFPTAMDAVQAAVGVQMVFSEYNVSHRQNPLLVRIGVHLGDIYFTEDDAFGEGINIAARLEALSRPGRICLSQEVFNQVDGKMEFSSRDLGRVELKNITRVINAHELIIPSPPGTAAEEEAEPEAKAEAESEAESEAGGGSAEGSEAAARERLKEAWALWDRHAAEGEQGRRGPGGRRKHRQPGARAHGQGGRVFNSFAAEAVEAVEKVGQAFSERRREGAESSGRDPFGPYRRWRRRMEEQLDKKEGEFRGHLISYLAVNSSLLLINLLTSPGFPWFLFPAGGWGIGMVNHWAAILSLRKDVRALEKLPELDREELDIYKKIRSGERKHLSGWVSSLAVSAFLVMINVITSPGFFWAVIPAGIILITTFANTHSWKHRRKKLWNRLKDLLGRARPVEGGSDFDSANSQQDSSGEESASEQKTRRLKQEAERLRLSILEQMDSFENNPLGEDSKEVLDNYVNQIGVLSEKNREMEKLLSSVPLDGLEAEVTDLRERASKTSSPSLKREYEHSLEEIERQQQSVTSLREQKEVLELRMNSAVNNLKQMNIDLARMKNLSEGEDAGPQAEKLHQRSRELSHYIEDFTQSYQDLSLDKAGE